MQTPSGGYWGLSLGATQYCGSNHHIGDGILVSSTTGVNMPSDKVVTIAVLVFYVALIVLIARFGWIKF